jgi:hypothetical protein
MAAALLAKLKINNPPVKKQDIEINIREKRDVDKPAVDKPGPAAPAIDKPGPAAPAIDKPGPAAPAIEKHVVKIIDDSKNADFDRVTYLKTFQKPKFAIEPAKAPIEPAKAPIEPPIEPVPAPVQEPATKKKTTRKIRPKEPTMKEPAMKEPTMKEPAMKEPTMKEMNETDIEPTKTHKVTIRRTKKPLLAPPEGPLALATLGDADIPTRLKKRNEASITVPASAYYMNNREIFVNFMASLFNDYKKNLAEEDKKKPTCPGDDDVNDFSLMTHQRIVRDYLNLYSPYRGLLLYHGLGSGKTCSSIAIAEGLKNAKPIIVLTPASLQVNYREELKKCGDELYKKNQYWEFIHTGTGTGTGTGADADLVDTLAKVLTLSVDHIRKNGGAWMVNMSKPSNYDQLSAIDKLKLDAQIEQMISHKYRFIKYNGLRASHLTELTKNNTINPFDDSVVIVDEAHNLVSRIVNKLGKKKGSIGLTLYQLLMKAKNVKIVLLSGTPIINYPNEISILFNILRGYITSWSFKLDILADRQINTAYLQSLFKSTVLGGHILDYLEYKSTSTTLVITRNPFGFVNKAAAKDNSYAGVKFEIGERGEISDDTFVKLVTAILKKNSIKVQAVAMQEYKALPDTLDAFKGYFLQESGELKNMNMFKRRILGLTSYFRSAQESLMPRYKKENPADFQLIRIEMSDFQFGVYEEARALERNQEKKNAQNKKLKKPGVEGLYEETTSTYRIFSRAFCNFVFPRPLIKRPMPDKKNKKGEELDLAEAIEDADEDDLDAVSEKEKAARDEEFAGEGEGEGEGEAGAAGPGAYKDRIQQALQQLEKDGKKYLSPDGLQVYSPKFLHMLENIQDVDHEGIHLIYTQFRALEGIGILKLVLEANGFTQFKIKKVGENWELAIPEADAGKPTFALYTGTESPEEKEIIRNVLNGAWKYVPETVVKKLKLIAPNNTLGEIIKVLMITSSGAEGISLKNVRYVHITEPYWHPVRTEQVIGRARRICSHQGLPEELRTVNVFLYLMTFSKKQLEGPETIELRLKDISRKDGSPVSTDEAIYEIACAKEDITNSILKAVKEASIDCTLHLKSNASEKLQCFSFGSNNPAKFGVELAIENEQSDEIADRNKKAVEWKAKILELGGTKYALHPQTNEVYDLESYMNQRPLKVGNLVKMDNGQVKLEMI